MIYVSIQTQSPVAYQFYVTENFAFGFLSLKINSLLYAADVSFYCWTQHTENFREQDHEKSLPISHNLKQKVTRVFSLSLHLYSLISCKDLVTAGSQRHDEQNHIWISR